MKLKKTLQAIALCCGLAGVGSANASVMLFDDAGDVSSILYSATYQGATLSATVQFTLNSLTATQAVFGVQISNDSTGPGNNRLTSFGIDIVSPTLISAVSNGGWGLRGTSTSHPSIPWTFASGMGTTAPVVATRALARG